MCGRRKDPPRISTHEMIDNFVRDYRDDPTMFDFLSGPDSGPQALVGYTLAVMGARGDKCPNTVPTTVMHAGKLLAEDGRLKVGN